MTKRDYFIDYLRGVAIIDMILVHYCWAFPEIISKIISYHDIAIEGFILLAGFSVGKYYYPVFIKKKKVINKILIRILKILIIQYLIILLISLPQYIIITDDTGINSCLLFLIKSFTFYNQIGLVHILPTFIPLFVFSPLLLYLLSLNLDWVVLLSSACFFILGQCNPYIFNYGDLTIFPVILWQIYFVAGCLLGKRSNVGRSPAISNKVLYLSLFSLIIALVAKHSLLLGVISLKINYDIVIGRFPLNVYGLVFSSSLWFFIYAMSKRLWPTIKDRSMVGLVSLFGRHSLLVFVIHICFAEILECYRFFDVTNFIILYSMILMNFIFTYYVLCRYELHPDAKDKGFLGFVKWLFN